MSSTDIEQRVDAQQTSHEFTREEQQIIKLLICRKAFNGIHSRMLKVATQVEVALGQISVVEEASDQISVLATAHNQAKQNFSLTIDEIATTLGIGQERLVELSNYVFSQETKV